VRLTLSALKQCQQKNKGLSGEYQGDGANAGWRCQFRCAVHGFWPGVAQLFSLGDLCVDDIMRSLLIIFIFALIVGCSTSSPTATRSEKPDAIVPSLAVAKQQYHDGQLDSAALTLRAIVSACPTNQEAYYYLCLVNQVRYAKTVGRQQIEREQQHWR
jgi:hypothetical protein